MTDCELLALLHDEKRQDNNFVHSSIQDNLNSMKLYVAIL